MDYKTLTTAISGLLIGLLMMGLFGFSQNNQTLMIEDPSKYDYETTIDHFEEAVDRAGWSIVNTHNMQQMMERHGHHVNSITIFEVCSARYSVKILEQDDERVISPLMPCRVAIYEKSDGKTYISRMDNEAIGQPYGGVIQNVMTTATRDVENILAGLID